MPRNVPLEHQLFPEYTGRWRGACGEIYVAGKLAHTELNTSVPDIYSCVWFITGVFTEHTMCPLIALGEAKHLTRIDITPNGLPVNQRHLENTDLLSLS